MRVIVLVVALVASSCASDGVVDASVGEPADTSAELPDGDVGSGDPAALDLPTTTGTSTASGDATDEPSTTTPSAPPAGPGGEGVDDPYFPSLGNGGYDVSLYDVAMTVDPDTEVLDVVVAITATSTRELTQFNLDLAGFEVSAVTVDGVAADVLRQGEEMTVVPANSIAFDAAFETVVAYSGTPTRIVSPAWGDGVGWIDAGSYSYVVSEPSGAHGFLPLNDHPSDKAIYRLAITVPDNLDVIANGTLSSKEVGPDGTTWLYEPRDPMASYLLTIGVGDFEFEELSSAGGVAIRNVYGPNTMSSAQPLLAIQGEMIDVLSELFGPYPFETYGAFVVQDNFGGALENQTLSVFSGHIFSNPILAERIMVHEVAHQWFGNALTLATWNDIWLNEGFATYSEWLWREATEPGFDIDEFAIDHANRGRPVWGAPGDPGPTQLFAPTVYQRGGLTLHAIRRTIGDDAFFAGLSTYVENNLHSNVSTDDFRQTMEDASGQSLVELFEGWLYAGVTPAMPD